jgi:hypothetical protein
MQWYPGDWRKDVGVQSLSYHDRGVWHELLMLMHESERRGVLTLNGTAMDDDSIGRLLGLDKQILTTTLTTLLTTGVASREEGTGALMCRRMVRDENLRQIRTEAGKQGGNPVLLKQKPTTGVKQKSTPSSSSSTSSTKQQSPEILFELPKCINQELWEAYRDMRKKKRAPMTERARDLIIRKLCKWSEQGYDINAILETSITRNWTDVFEPKTSPISAEPPKPRQWAPVTEMAPRGAQ